MLEDYNPAQAEVRKEDSLWSGESASNICLQPSGQPAFQAGTNPAWNNVGNEFGGAWNLEYNTLDDGSARDAVPGGLAGHILFDCCCAVVGGASEPIGPGVAAGGAPEHVSRARVEGR